MTDTYDVIVIGAGAAGLTAALFAARHGQRTLLLERLMAGGQVINAERIENFPGFPQGISGYELGPKLQEQATAAGVDVRLEEATALRPEAPYHLVSTTLGQHRGKAVVIASGSTLRTLGIPGEARLHGKGVSNCASCDGPLFEGQVVGVVGGGDSALDEALALTQYASQVIVFHRRNAFTAQRVLQDRVLAHPKVTVRWSTIVEEIQGEDQVDGVVAQDLVSGETWRDEVAGVFIYVGLEPNTRFLNGVLALDNAGHIPTDIWMATELPGVYAAGDIRQQSAAQLVTAAGDGATAAIAAHRYIAGREWP